MGERKGDKTDGEADCGPLTGEEWRAAWDAGFLRGAYLTAAAGVGAYYLLVGLNPDPMGGLRFGLCAVMGVKGLTRREKCAGEAVLGVGKGHRA